MRKFSIILFLLVGHLLGDEVPIEVRYAITRALEGNWAQGYVDVKKNHWGIETDSILFDVKAGEPFQMYVITQEFFKRADENASVSSLITPGDWYVPVYVNGILLKTGILVMKQPQYDQKWTVGSRNIKGLAEAWQQIKKTWPESKGYHPKFVVIQEPALNSACFFIPEKGEDNLTVFGQYYLWFTPSAGVSYSNLTSSKELLNSLRNKCKEDEKKSHQKWTEKRRADSTQAEVLAKKREQETRILWQPLQVQYDKAASQKAISPKRIFPGAHAVAYQYLAAIAFGDSTNLYKSTGRQYNKAQLLQLRMQLFGKKEVMLPIREHSYPGRLMSEAEEQVHVQHIILSNGYYVTEGGHWAFRIICVQWGGFWGVADILPDPEISDEKVAEIVYGDKQRQIEENTRMRCKRYKEPLP